MTQRSIQLQTFDASANAAWRGVARNAALVAIAFCLTVAALVATVYLQDRRDNPLTSEKLTKLKTALTNQPTDDSLKQEIRRVDLKVRDEFFRRRQIILRGGYLALGGIIVLLIALKTVAKLNQRPPNPLTDFAPPVDPWTTA